MPTIAKLVSGVARAALIFGSAVIASSGSVAPGRSPPLIDLTKS
jgi:hypothetical protein